MLITTLKLWILAKIFELHFIEFYAGIDNRNIQFSIDMNMAKISLVFISFH